MGIGIKTGIIASSGNAFSNVYSLDFDGTDDYINCGTASNLNFERTDSFSYSFWVKRNSVGTNHMMLSNMNPSGNRRGMFFNLNSGNNIVVMLRTDTSFDSQRLLWKSTSTILANSTWRHIVFTYDGSSSINGGKIYIDGAADTLHSDSGGGLSATIIPSSTTPFLIATLSTAPLLPADALMDEVAVFTTKLSASDVANIYNGGGTGKPGDLSSFNPHSWWRFEEGSGTTATDSGTGGNNGTLTDGPTYQTDVPS